MFRINGRHYSGHDHDQRVAKVQGVYSDIQHELMEEAQRLGFGGILSVTLDDVAIDIRFNPESQNEKDALSMKSRELLDFIDVLRIKYGLIATNSYGAHHYRMMPPRDFSHLERQAEAPSWERSEHDELYEKTLALLQQPTPICSFNPSQDTPHQHYKKPLRLPSLRQEETAPDITERMLNSDEEVY